MIKIIIIVYFKYYYNRFIIVIIMVGYFIIKIYYYYSIIEMFNLYSFRKKLFLNFLLKKYINTWLLVLLIRKLIFKSSKIIVNIPT